MDPKRGPADPPKPVPGQAAAASLGAEEYDGRKTLVDGPPKMEHAEDPEEKATELWAPAVSLFDGKRPRLEPEEADTDFDPGRSGEYLQNTRDTAEDLSDLAPHLPATDSKPPGRQRLPDTGLQRRPPEPPRATDLISGELEVKELLNVIEDPAPAGGARLSDSVEVSGEIGEAARRLAEEEHERGLNDPSMTMVIDVPRNAPRLSHECRICGRKITTPKPARFRGSPQGGFGFRCDKCSNVFCATHVVRVSGLLESLFRQGRFRCVLCMPEAQPKKGEE